MIVDCAAANCFTKRTKDTHFRLRVSVSGPLGDLAVVRRLFCLGRGLAHPSIYKGEILKLVHFNGIILGLH